MNITKDNFNEVIKQYPDLVIDFYADWCNPCKALAPLLEEIEKDYPAITFAKVNIEEEPGLSTIFEITSIPYVVRIKDGKYYDSFVGLIPRHKIEEFLSR